MRRTVQAERRARLTARKTELLMSIRDNYIRLQNEIAELAVSRKRNPGDVRIIAVSKTFSAAAVQEAIDAGIRVFGENRIQEAGQKIPLLAGDFTFHLVGHLQSNKAREAVELFDLIHSIDKFSTAERVSAEAQRFGKRQKILIQVNTSGENSKSGVSPDQAQDLAGRIGALADLELLGLMTMAPFTEDEEPVRKSFRTARETLEKINGVLNLGLSELSMGMSSDYRIAVEEGATMVRIGTALFGQRDAQ